MLSKQLTQQRLQATLQMLRYQAIKCTAVLYFAVSSTRLVRSFTVLRICCQLAIAVCELASQMSTMTNTSASPSVSLICMLLYVMALISVPLACRSRSKRSPRLIKPSTLQLQHLSAEIWYICLASDFGNSYYSKSQTRCVNLVSLQKERNPCSPNGLDSPRLAIQSCDLDLFADQHFCVEDKEKLVQECEQQRV